MPEDTHQLLLFSVSDYQMPLPDYDVRESSRARHVSLRVSFQGTLEVVVPPGFDRGEIPKILDRRRDWIARTIQRIEHQRQSLPADHQAEKPDSLELRSRQQTWQVTYEVRSDSALTLTQSGDFDLILAGPVQDAIACRDLLRNWLQRQARAELGPWLQTLSQRCDLAYSRCSVRGQTSRWGSCSSRQAISLNYKLLFLPPPMVDYVLIHELCHTVHMNHSPAFWNLVRRYCPECDRIRADLKKAWQYVPHWVDA
ncbi:M48 family metallopeptidase [Leptolyngbya sp. PCC 6406]|uniref:M48 family metallopeptidase n=1 Tax=Leptolyngbya sp. PCC 6406 TaxID=1173264 RepID=UPI0002ABECE4|nr:SprT family zinc-dependent metalloprotease [Leptolyngbya sp. PCC 6406]